MKLISENILHRHPENPILRPADFPGADAVFNCGQTLYKGKPLLLVAVVLKGQPTPRMHVAESENGIHFTIRKEPLVTRSNKFEYYDTWPIDPRITYMANEDTYYIMRPANSASGCCAILGKTRDFETYEEIEIIALPNNRVPSLFPEKINGLYARLDRPYSLIDDPHNQPQMGHIWISFSPDLVYWGRHRLLLTPWTHWNRVKIGPTPPIKTKDGWLVIIHGVGVSCSGQRYHIGAMLLDLNDPTRLIGKMESYLLAPDTEYEFMGRVPNVVFPCGAIGEPEKDLLRVYYGGADTCINLATGSLSEVVEACKKGL